MASDALEEVANERDNILRQVAKAESDTSLWRQKCQTDAVAKAEELVMTKMKLTARLTEAEALIENLNNKLHQLERARPRCRRTLTR